MPPTYLGVFFTPDASDCDLNVPAPGPVTWYIIAGLGGDAAAPGITGAEFRLAGIPAGWFMSFVPSPAASFVDSPGNPTVGTRIAFPSCQQGPYVLLYTLTGFAATQVGPTCLSILPHTTPSNPDFTCPQVIVCDAPVFTRLCVSTQLGVINGSCFTPNCTIAVEERTWTQVKGIYQD